MKFVRQSFTVLSIALLLCVGQSHAMGAFFSNAWNNVTSGVKTAYTATKNAGYSAYTKTKDLGSSAYEKTTDALTSSVADATYNATLSLLTGGGSAYATRNVKIGLPLMMAGILGRFAFNKYYSGSAFNRHSFLRSFGEGLCGAGLATLGGHNNGYRKLMGVSAFALGGLLLSQTLQQEDPEEAKV
ncbi:TPA: hypothetical protein DDZ86_04350 [Candidatus Dependentiae bacterium]|nr:MAG: hypothetical protein UW09_C0003G0219 [candidate division TM6 bacterium GW2011_GWF2_43_87]HBL98843.1 hypothetical protein [Candidatus Dependentiae bacterium]